NSQQAKQQDVPAKAAPSPAKAAPSSAKAAPAKAAPAQAFQEKAPPAMEVQSKDILERNLRGKSAGANGLPENGARPKQAPRKKDFRGSSFFIKKVQKKQKKKSQPGGLLKLNKIKALPFALAGAILVTLTAGIVIEGYRKWPKLYALVTRLAST